MIFEFQNLHKYLRPLYGNTQMFTWSQNRNWLIIGQKRFMQLINENRINDNYKFWWCYVNIKIELVSVDIYNN